MLRKSLLSIIAAFTILTAAPVVSHNVVPASVEAAISTPAFADHRNIYDGGSNEPCIRGGCWRGRPTRPQAHGGVVYAPGGSYYPPRGRIGRGASMGGQGNRAVQSQQGSRLVTSGFSMRTTQRVFLGTERRHTGVLLVSRSTGRQIFIPDGR